MKEYTIFAEEYDQFMSEIPYKKWASQIDEYLCENNFKNSDILELGCGTGNFTLQMAEKGYTMTGVDLSEKMIQVAIKKTRKTKYKINYFLQDMRILQVPNKYPVIISVCDSLNYLEDFFDLQFTFQGIYKGLEKGGQFIFDLKTEAFYKSLGDSVFTDETENGYYIWENEYQENTKINNYYLTFFIKRFKNYYKKYNEMHSQHVFTEQEVRQAAMEAGLSVKYLFGMDFKTKANFMEERVYYVLERKDD